MGDETHNYAFIMDIGCLPKTYRVTSWNVFDRWNKFLKFVPTIAWLNEPNSKQFGHYLISFVQSSGQIYTVYYWQCERGD